MPSMTLLFLFGLVEPGPSGLCVSVMSSLIPIFDKYSQDLWLIIYSLKYTMRRIKYSCFSTYIPLLSGR